MQERLKSYLQSKSMSFKDFEILCGLSNGTAARLRPTTRQSTFDRIANACDLNINWLLTGEGEMTNEPSEHSATDNDNKERLNLIPFYDAETTGGYQGAISSSEEEVHLKGYIQAGGWFDHKETAAIRHVGDSMIEYPNGCVLVVREVFEWNLLIPGKNYVIETSEYRITKRIQKGSTQDTITLYSSNPEKYEDGRLIHEPFEVAKEDIRRIFSVLGYIVNESGEFRLIRP